MARRVLICLDDQRLAAAVGAALDAEGTSTELVAASGLASSGADPKFKGLVLQDRYTDGSIGTSLLRQLRSNRGEPLAGVLLTRSEIAEATRHVLASQYGIQSFLGPDVDGVAVAQAVLALAPATSPAEEPDLVLHEDEAASQFDIEIASNDAHPPIPPDDAFDEATDSATAAEMPRPMGSTDATFLDAMSDDFENEKTVGVPLMQLAPVKAVAYDDNERAARARARVDDGDTDPRAQTNEVSLEMLSMPAPGASHDLELPVTSPGGSAEGDEEATALNSTPDLPQSPAVPAPLMTSEDTSNPNHADTPNPANAPDEDDMSQVQELKKALLSKKRALENAQKRIEDLEEQLAAAEPGGASTEGIPDEGMFEDLRYPVLLSRCRAAAFTGAVDMQLPGGTTRTIYINNGLPMAFSTSEPGEKIGKVLVEQGRISDEQYVKAATRMVERGIKLSEALVELGLITAQALEVEVRNLTRDQIIRGFELTKGRFKVNEGMAVPDNVPTFDFGPGEVYVEGYRTAAPSAEMQGLYEQLRPKYLIANARLASFRPKLGLTGSDERLLRLLGEAYTVEEAVERAKVEAEAAARLIAALQALDLVEEWSPGVEQFRARLTSERQHFADELARIRQENIQREQQLFEGFESALAKITAAMGSGSPPSGNLAEHLSAGAAPKPAKSEKTAAAETQPKASKIVTPKASPAPKPAASKPAASSTASSASTSVVIADEPPPPAPAPTPKAEKPARELAEDLPPPPGMGDDHEVTVEATADLLQGVQGGAMASEGPFSTAALPPPETPADEKHHAALDLASAGQLDDAEVTLREAVRMDASRPEYLVSLARILLANPRYERAGTLPVVRSLLDRAVQLSPDHAEARNLHQEIVSEMDS